MEFSPRFRSTDSRPQDPSTYPSHHSTSPSKLRLMCSTGGHIVPRPHDKSLCYVGGETRMVAVDRHTTLQDLTHRLSKTLFRSSTTSPPASSFTLKYQLPSEDLDSLISVTTDEDLENMIDEYERLNSSSRLRLFIFPTNPESVSSIGSFLENPSKSEDWFLNALNGTVSGFSDTSSFNCLLDLDDEISLPEKKEAIGTTVNNSGQDVHSIPDSGQETTSSFGSASSTPSLANLPPIRVNGDDHQVSVQKGNHKVRDDGGLMVSPAPVAVSGSPVSSAAENQDHSDPFVTYQQQSIGFDLVSTDSILSDLTITDQSSSISQIQSSSSNNQATDPNDFPDQNTRIQILQPQKHHNSAYLPTTPTSQVGSPSHQFHHQQPQFIPPPQYIHHHHHPPVTSYYQHHPHHQPIDQQNFMYYIPTPQPPQGYNFPLQQQPDTRAAAAMNTELPPGVYRTTSEGAPQLVRVPSGYQNQPQHVGYTGIHQPTQAVYYATPVSVAQYQKRTSVEAGLQEQQVRTAQQSHER